MIPVCPLSAIPRGESYRWKVDPPVTIFHTEDGQVFAIDDTCTHQDASLSDGWLEGCEIECPLHASRFDLRTVQVDAPPAKKPVRTHQVMISDETVHVALSDRERDPRPGPPSAARHSPT